MARSRRVVVTGIGVASSIGAGRDKFWKNLIRGKSGISKVESFDTSRYENHNGGEIKDFNPADFMDKGRLKNLGRGSQFAIAAGKMALEDARVDFDKIDRDRTGIAVGTTMADAQRIEEMDKIWVELSEKDVDSKLIPQYPGSVLASNLGFELRLGGPNISIPTACSAGNYSIGYSYDLIKEDRVDYMLAGGSDPFSRIAFTGFNRLFAVAPEKCQPFDKNRRGMMVGEGAGVLLLEELEHARSRKADIYAEVRGYALSCDAHHMTAPSVEGIAQVMKRAIRNAGLKEDDIGYISAHGTGTPSNDRAECQAIRQIFARRYKEIPISSIKSMLGHTMGAASAIEAIACCLAIREGVIPPTMNYETPDPECDIDCVPNEARETAVEFALNNSLAFGGNDACLVLGRYHAA
jgi:3-oxoacyl-[acyl-carrier-protein] synthase II